MAPTRARWHCNWVFDLNNKPNLFDFIQCASLFGYSVVWYISGMILKIWSIIGCVQWGPVHSREDVWESIIVRVHCGPAKHMEDVWEIIIVCSQWGPAHSQRIWDSIIVRLQCRPAQPWEDMLVSIILRVQCGSALPRMNVRSSIIMRIWEYQCWCVLWSGTSPGRLYHCAGTLWAGASHEECVRCSSDHLTPRRNHIFQF